MDQSVEPTRLVCKSARIRFRPRHTPYSATEVGSGHTDIHRSNADTWQMPADSENGSSNLGSSEPLPDRRLVG